MHNIPTFDRSSVDDLDLSFFFQFLKWDLLMASQILIPKCNACSSAIDQRMCRYLLVIHDQCTGYNQMFPFHWSLQYLRHSNWETRNSKPFQNIQKITFPVNWRAILVRLNQSFPDYSEPVPAPTFFTSTPAALNVWALFHAAHSAALWLNLAQYKYIQSVNRFALSTAEILLLPALSSIVAGPVYPATVPAWAPAGFFGGAGGLGEEAKPVPPPIFCAACSARHCRIWITSLWHTVTKAGSSSGISLYLKESVISSEIPMCTAFCRANRFQSRSAAITWNSA